MRRDCRWDEESPAEWVRRVTDAAAAADDPSEYLAEMKISEAVGEYLARGAGDELPLEDRMAFLEAAAELTRKKARGLVRTPEDDGEDDLEDAERSERLLEHLLEYRRYQLVAEELRDRAEEMDRRHPRVPPEIAEWEEALADIEGADLSDLVSALESILSEDVPEVQTIERERISVSQCMRDIRDRLRDAEGPLEFSAIFPLHLGRQRVVVTFVALLEMIRRGEVRVAQSERFGPILLYDFSDGAETGGEAHV